MCEIARPSLILCSFGSYLESIHRFDQIEFIPRPPIIAANREILHSSYLYAGYYLSIVKEINSRVKINSLPLSITICIK